MTPAAFLNRRDVLRAPLLLTAVGPTNAQSPAPAGPASVLIRAGNDRDGKTFKFLDATFNVVLSGKDTSGRCVVFDTLRPAKVGPQLHLHTDCDEWFYVLEGEFRFRAGEEMLQLRAGDTLLVPVNMPHAFVKTSEGVARLIVMHEPAGTMEEYFRESSLEPDQSPEARKVRAEKHGMRFLGPALKAE